MTGQVIWEAEATWAQYLLWAVFSTAVIRDLRI